MGIRIVKELIVRARQRLRLGCRRRTVVDVVTAHVPAEAVILAREDQERVPQLVDLPRHPEGLVGEQRGEGQVAFELAFVELGQDVHVVGGGLNQAIDEGVRQGYTEGYLRASIVRTPFGDRKNTGDNTPAVVHVDVVPGAQLKVMVMAKGGGCENRSKYRMLTPAEGLDGAKAAARRI